MFSWSCANKGEESRFSFGLDSVVAITSTTDDKYDDDDDDDDVIHRQSSHATIAQHWRRMIVNSLVSVNEGVSFQLRNSSISTMP